MTIYENDQSMDILFYIISYTSYDNMYLNILYSNDTIEIFAKNTDDEQNRTRFTCDAQMTIKRADIFFLS